VLTGGRKTGRHRQNQKPGQSGRLDISGTGTLTLSLSWCLQTQRSEEEKVASRTKINRPLPVKPGRCPGFSLTQTDLRALGLWLSGQPIIAASSSFSGFNRGHIAADVTFSPTFAGAVSIARHAESAHEGQLSAVEPTCGRPDREERVGPNPDMRSVTFCGGE
jgi:hypothetical protein